jgi:hypothetical protein
MAPSSDYAGRAAEHVGLNYCVYPTADPKTKIVRWFSFFYGYADFSGGDAGLEDFAPRLRDRLAVTSFTIPDNELPLYPGETLPGGRLDEQAMLLLDHRQLMGHLAAKGAARVVFDVRENGGGSFDPIIVADFAMAPFRQLATQVVWMTQGQPRSAQRPTSRRIKRPKSARSIRSSVAPQLVATRTSPSPLRHHGSGRLRL